MNKKSLLTNSLLALSVSAALAPAIAAETSSNENVEVIEVRQQRQAYRGDVPLKQMPQAVSIVSGDFLQDVGVSDLQTALDFTSGISRQNDFGGLFEGFAIRGFAGDENLSSAYLVNGFSSGRGYSGRRNNTNVESIEVLKGPGSALYGRGEPGGIVNVITKKPQFSEDGYLKATLGNFETKIFEADYTNAISEDVAFRVNGSYEGSGSFRDFVETKSLTANPSFLWKISDTTSFSYELEVLDQELPLDRGVVVLNQDFNTVPGSRFLGEPDDGNIEIKATGHQLLLQHQINANWDFLTGLSYRDSSFEGFGSEAELAGSRQLAATDGETLNRRRRYRDFDATDLSARFEFNGNFETAGLTHHMLIGMDTYDYELDTRMDQWRIGWKSGDTTFAINLNNPVYHQSLPVLDQVAIDQLEKQKSVGFYIQDQIDLSQKWKLLLGLRLDQFDQEIQSRKSGETQKQDDSTTSPRAGLVFEANEHITLYTSYAEGFRPNSGTDSNDNIFAPEESHSYEVGMKWSTTDDLFNGTLALFKTQKSNILTGNPETGKSEAFGEAESSGVELDIQSNIGENSVLTMSYAYIDAHTLNAMNDSAGFGVELPAGSSLINIAEHSGSLTVQHYLEVAGKESNIGASLHYVGERLGETIDPDYILPSYSTVRLFGSAKVTEELSLQFDVDNLFDKEYYANSYSKYWTMPGAPRNYRVSVRYQF